jgi:hypothetical protein
MREGFGIRNGAAIALPQIYDDQNGTSHFRSCPNFRRIRPSFPVRRCLKDASRRTSWTSPVRFILPVQGRFGGSAADVLAVQVVSFAPTSANGLANEAFAANPLSRVGRGKPGEKADGQIDSAQGSSAGRGNHRHKSASRQINRRIALDDRGRRQPMGRQVSRQPA